MSFKGKDEDENQGVGLYTREQEKTSLPFTISPRSLWVLWFSSAVFFSWLSSSITGVVKLFNSEVPSHICTDL